MVSMGGRWVRSGLPGHDYPVGRGAVLYVETSCGSDHEDCTLLSSV